jgi:hypothetical protein
LGIVTSTSETAFTQSTPARIDGDHEAVARELARSIDTSADIA